MSSTLTKGVPIGEPGRMETTPTQSVYLVQAGPENGPLKIGFSSDVAKRLESLRTGNHLPLSLLDSIECPHAAELERALHGEFDRFRLEGEWFRYHEQIPHTLAALKLLNGDVYASDRDEHRIINSLRARVGQIAREPVTDEDAEPWVVEWSDAQGYIHLSPLRESIAMAHEQHLFGRGEPTDYVVVALVGSHDQASDASDVLEPWLRAVRFARRHRWREKR